MKFFVGSYTKLGGPGVALCELLGETMRLLEVSSELTDPSYVILSADQSTLYVASGSSANGEEGGSVAAYDVSGGRLNYVCRQSTLGVSTCHLTLSPDERFLYAASYFTGSIAVFRKRRARLAPRPADSARRNRAERRSSGTCPRSFRDFRSQGRLASLRRRSGNRRGYELSAKP